MALVAAAFVVPAYSGETCRSLPGSDQTCGPAPSQTLFAVNGWWVVELLAAVALVTALAFYALHVVCAKGSDAAAGVATVCIVALLLFSFVTGFSIGLFVFPAAVLLAASAWLIPEGGRLRTE
jgi:hypothetical protein